MLIFDIGQKLPVSTTIVSLWAHKTPHPRLFNCRKSLPFLGLKLSALCLSPVDYFENYIDFWGDKTALFALSIVLVHWLLSRFYFKPGVKWPPPPLTFPLDLYQSLTFTLFKSLKTFIHLKQRLYILKSIDMKQIHE